MSELVQKLAKGEHRVIIRAVADNPIEELQQSIERDYVHVKFTETRGGTELGFKLDSDVTDLGHADFEKGTGRVHLAGDLTLDYVKVRCVADVDIETMQGTGHLEILEEESVN